MKKIKTLIEQNNNLILRMLITSLIGALAIFADFRLKIINTSLNGLIEILFSTVTVIAGLWISCYLLFVQLYKDRYPIKILKDCYLPNMRENFATVLFCIVYGSVVIVINNGIIANLFYSVMCIATIIEIMLKIYNTNKSLMVNTYVDKVFQEISNDLKASKNTIDKNTFSHIECILDESVVKEEFYIVQNITERVGELYRDFLVRSLGFVGENANHEDIENSFNNIVEFNLSELKLCSKISSETTIDKVIWQQVKNIVFCIEKQQYEWFKEYISAYSVFVYKMQREGNVSFSERLYTTYKSVIKKLIDDDKEEWLAYINEQLNKMIKSLVFFYDNTGIRSYCNLLSGALVYCIDKGKEASQMYKDLYASFCDFSSLISKSNGVFDDVKMYYAFLFNEQVQKGYFSALYFYENVLEKAFVRSEDPVLLEFKMYCTSELIRIADQDTSRNKMLLNKQIDTLIDVIGMKEKYQGYLLLPDFKKIIIENQYSSMEEIESIKDTILKLFNNCIIKDNLPMFYTLMNNLNEVLASTEQRQKEIQKELLNIYIVMIYRTRTLVNKEYLQITFQLFDDVIRDLDTKRKISSDLGDYIVTHIAEAAHNGNRDNHTVIIKAIDMLYSFLDKKEHLSFMVTNSDKKKKLYRCMFNIGTSCIENNFEEGLRRVSNALGWLAISSIEQGTSELTMYLIERASELYRISKNMEISSKTQTFLLTLFTTIGTFCCKNPSYSRYLKKIIVEIKDEEIGKIKTAISLRTSENDTWNSLFDNDTIGLSRKFLAEFKNAKERTNS